MKKGKKYYAVKKGRTQGIFLEWELARQQVEGYPGAKYKSFATKKEANEYLHDNEQTQEQARRKRLIQAIKTIIEGFEQGKEVLVIVEEREDCRTLEDLVVKTCNIESEVNKLQRMGIPGRTIERLGKDENY